MFSRFLEMRKQTNLDFPVARHHFLFLSILGMRKLNLFTKVFEIFWKNKNSLNVTHLQCMKIKSYMEIIHKYLISLFLAFTIMIGVLSLNHFLLKFNKSYFIHDLEETEVKMTPPSLRRWELGFQVKNPIRINVEILWTKWKESSKHNCKIEIVLLFLYFHIPQGTQPSRFHFK